ncbi:hypothetical protein AcW1_010106 [Taiwanofungus camphoratus]|nr:hypothetical protein AcW1_010106 [Antrodia cinnamomea]
MPTSTTLLDNTVSRPSSTPIRAITSTLSARSAPSVPPASQTFEPLVKAILRHRLLYKVLLPSFVFSWLLVIIWSIWNQGGPSALGVTGTLAHCVLPLTWVYTGVTWICGAVPAMVLRNRFLTVTPTPASSPSKMFRNALTKRSTPYALLTYIASAIALTMVHVFMTYTYESTTSRSSRLSFFVKSKKHPYYLNGRVLYLLSSQLAFACTYLLRNILLDRFVVRWTDRLTSSDGSQPKSFRLARVITVLVTLTLFATFCTAGHTLLFGFARSVLLPLLYSVPFLPRVLRPFSAHFLRGPWTFVLLVRHWPLVCRTFCLGLSTVLIWEFAESPIDEVTSVAHNTADPALTLVSGASSSDAYFKHFAYAELKQLASEDSPVASARRSSLFADQKYNPSIWSCLVRGALLTLGKDYQLLLRRGKPEAAAPTPPSQSKAFVGLPAPATPLIRAPILKAAPPSPLRAALDSFASDGPLSTAVASTAEAGASHIPELFRSVLPPDSTAMTAVESAKKSEEKVLGFIQQTGTQWRQRLGAVVCARAPASLLNVVEQVVEWWRRDRLHKAVEVSLPNRHLDALAASVLCHLTCASLTEDRYGVVQRDIPRILEALLTFLTAIEDYQAEINKLHSPPSPEDLHSLSAKDLAEKERLMLEVVKAGEVLSEVGDALKEGIAQIARTFGDKLAAFKFPPRTALKLQGFVDYM